MSCTIHTRRLRHAWRTYIAILETSFQYKFSNLWASITSSEEELRQDNTSIRAKILTLGDLAHQIVGCKSDQDYDEFIQLATTVKNTAVAERREGIKTGVNDDIIEKIDMILEAIAIKRESLQQKFVQKTLDR